MVRRSRILRLLPAMAIIYLFIHAMKNSWWISVPSSAAEAPIMSNSVENGTRVVAIVFYGRKEFASVLACYLERNLRENGGLLDQVVFAVKTQDKNDLDFLEELLKTHKSYVKHVPNTHYNIHPDGYKNIKLDWFSRGSVPDWHGSWEAVSEPDTIYIKIDDDILYIEDGAIAGIVGRLVDNPQYFAVSANIVNGAAMQWVHQQMDVYKPFYPESEFTTDASVKENEYFTNVSWRTSQLPTYDGPAEGPDNYNPDGSSPAPFRGHRWLPVRSENVTALRNFRSPALTLTFDAWGPSVLNWAAAAQCHYSFLQHLEEDTTWQYKFSLWNYNFTRLAINFFAIRGRDVLDVFPFPTADDEEFLTVTRPQELERPVVVHGTSLVVHYAFDKQRRPHGQRALSWTDVLSRYSSYANEYICFKS